MTREAVPAQRGESRWRRSAVPAERVCGEIASICTKTDLREALAKLGNVKDELEFRVNIDINNYHISLKNMYIHIGMYVPLASLGPEYA